MAETRTQPSLQAAGHPLADARNQLARLDALPMAFDEALRRSGHGALRTTDTAVLQVNLGKRCNQTCRHCHVDAGPDRREVMPDDVLDACLAFLAASNVQTLDITGGAPELHPRFRDLVRQARELGRHVIDRCNLTIVTLPAYQDLPAFFAAHQVEVVASLPAISLRNTDAQRGDGVFAASLDGLKRLNAVGYGQPGSGLTLNLVTNPAGAFLPGNQASLEREWQLELSRRYGIRFNHLYTITNMPISRFLQFLVDSGNLEPYMDRLLEAFNPAAIKGLMCRSTLSVGWDGRLFDCDFNQMLELPIDAACPQTIHAATQPLLAHRPITVAPHCFGCTAGAGSSCGGTTV